MPRRRVCLDLNIFVAAEIALAKGRERTTPLLLVRACRDGTIDLVISRRMIDRLTDVLCRPPLNLNHALATERTALIAELAALPNLVVAGGGVMPVRDVEDRGVLEAAMAGGANDLATYNLDDFSNVARGHREGAATPARDLRIVHPLTLANDLGLH